MELTDISQEKIIEEITQGNVNPGVIEKFLEDLPSKAFSLGIKIVLCLLVFWIGTRIIKMILSMVQRSMTRAGAEHGVKSFVNSFLKAFMMIVLIFMELSWFGVNTASVVALLGSAGVAIGLAVQGSLSNLAGGVLILILKPFKVGDYIKEDKHGNEGTVTDIQIFYTKLTTADNRVVVLPNGDLANSSLTNVTANPVRRVDIPVSIAYSADIKNAKEVLLAMMKKSELVVKDNDILVYVDDLADSSVVLKMRCYLKQEDYWNGKWSLTEDAKYALDKAGIEIPFNQLDVHMK